MRNRGSHERVLRAVGRRIAELRVQLGMTQEQFAEQKLRISLKYLQRVEAGLENLTVASLVRIAGACGVTVDKLFRPPKTTQVSRGRPRKRPPQRR